MKENKNPAVNLNLPDMVDQTAEKISRLRREQEVLQKQKAELEGLESRRRELIQGQQEMKLSLAEAISVLEREAGELQRSLNLVESFRDNFKGLLAEVGAIREETWDSANLKTELNDSLALVNRARTSYHEARGKIASLSCAEPGHEIALAPPSREPELPRDPAGFFRAGLYFFLPPFLYSLAALALLFLLKRL